jgi:hypothetical protein
VASLPVTQPVAVGTCLPSVSQEDIDRRLEDTLQDTLRAAAGERLDDGSLLANFGATSNRDLVEQGYDDDDDSDSIFGDFDDVPVNPLAHHSSAPLSTSRFGSPVFRPQQAVSMHTPQPQRRAPVGLPRVDDDEEQNRKLSLTAHASCRQCALMADENGVLINQLQSLTETEQRAAAEIAVLRRQLQAATAKLEAVERENVSLRLHTTIAEVGVNPLCQE